MSPATTHKRRLQILQVELSSTPVKEKPRRPISACAFYHTRVRKQVLLITLLRPCNNAGRLCLLDGNIGNVAQASKTALLQVS